MGSTKFEVAWSFLPLLHWIQVILVFIIAILVAHVVCHPSSSMTGIGFELFSQHHRKLVSLGLLEEDEYARMATVIKLSHKRFNQLAIRIAASTGNPSSKDVLSAVREYSGDYVMVVQLGTPTRELALVMDTGSAAVWVACAAGLLHPSLPFFDPQKSSSHSNVPCPSSKCQELTGTTAENCSNRMCEFVFGYAGNTSVGGIFATETLTLNGLSNMPKQFNSFTFGCAQTINDKTFQGIAGMSVDARSLPSQLAKDNVTNKFSYCLVPSASAAKVTSTLIIGDAAGLSGTGVQTTPLVQGKSNTYYYVNLQAISIGSINVTLPTYPNSSLGGTVFDSGTTLTYINAVAYPHIETAFLRGISHLPRVTVQGLNLCFDISKQQNYHVPPVVFHFENADMILAKDNFMFEFEKNTVCWALMPSFAPYQDLSIVGNINQQNFRILYNNEEKEISFVRHECDASASRSSSTP